MLQDLGCQQNNTIAKKTVSGYSRHVRDNKSTEAAFVEACHKVAEYGLVSCSSGNLSWRVKPNTALLSASGTWLAELTQDQVAACDISTGQCTNGKPPTCESVFHLGILKNRPQMNVVLHFQSPYAAAVACGDPENLNFNVIFEVPVNICSPAMVDCLLPGSEALAQATIDALSDPQTHIAILKNHGLVTVGKDFNDAIQKAVFFEMACRIMLINPNAKPLSAAILKELRTDGGAKA